VKKEKLKICMDQFALEESNAILMYALPMSADDFQIFQEWMAINLRKIERQVIANIVKSKEDESLKEELKPE
jgi:hypothetical protein